MRYIDTQTCTKNNYAFTMVFNVNVIVKVYPRPAQYQNNDISTLLKIFNKCTLLKTTYIYMCMVYWGDLYLACLQIIYSWWKKKITRTESELRYFKNSATDIPTRCDENWTDKRLEKEVGKTVSSSCSNSEQSHTNPMSRVWSSAMI